MKYSLNLNEELEKMPKEMANEADRFATASQSGTDLRDPLL